MNKKKTLLGTTIYFLLLYSLNAQNIRIEGTILSENNIPLVGATIAVNDQITSTTDQGTFNLEVEIIETQFLVSIRMLGYSSIDTLIALSMENVVLEIKMKERAYDIPSVKIHANSFNAFKFDKYNILDYIIRNEQIIILYTIGNKRYLSVFGMDGFELSTTILNKKYNLLYLSCSKQVHLLTDEEGVELYFSNAKIILSKPYEIKNFESLIKPCIANCEGELIFKNLTFHNKKALYFIYPEPNTPKLIATIMDVEGANHARSSYYKIMGQYRYSITNPEEGSIDEGIDRENIINNGTWSGNLIDLANSNDLLSDIAYYQNVESKEIDLREFSFEGNLYIMDFVNKKMIKIDIKKSHVNEFKIEGFNWHRKSKILIDRISGRPYILSNKMILYNLDIQKKECSFHEIQNLNLKGKIPQGFKIYNDKLYYFSYNQATYRNSKLYRIDFNTDN